MPRPETEPPKTNRVYSREDAARDLAIITTQTYVYISEMEDANRRGIQFIRSGKWRDDNNIAELLRAHSEEKQGKKRKVRIDFLQAMRNTEEREKGELQDPAITEKSDAAINHAIKRFSEKCKRRDLRTYPAMKKFMEEVIIG
jgi:hypothetical protein